MHRLLLIVLLYSLPLLGQAEWPKPNWEKTEVLRCDQQKVSTFPVGKYQVKLVPRSDAGGDKSCQSYLVEPSGREIPLLRDWTVSVYEGTGEDIFGNGNPSLILEGFSGGAHCCYTYMIADLSDAPLILSPVHNQTPFLVFKDTATKQFRILTSDGAFDYFDGLCHACAPFPRVVLQATRSGLRDVSSQFVDQYDSDIALARARIGGEGEIRKFEMSDFADAKPVVLEIVYSYLYSGREDEAWQTLDNMWPAADRERIKKLIIKTRATGLLSTLLKTSPRSLASLADRAHL